MDGIVIDIAVIVIIVCAVLAALLLTVRDDE